MKLSPIPSHDRDPKTEFANRADHLIDDAIVLARVGSVFNQAVDRPLLNRQLVGQVHGCTASRAR
jgi:hypothetical protein